MATSDAAIRATDYIARCRATSNWCSVASRSASRAGRLGGQRCPPPPPKCPPPPIAPPSMWPPVPTLTGEPKDGRAPAPLKPFDGRKGARASWALCGPGACYAFHPRRRGTRGPPAIDHLDRRSPGQSARWTGDRRLQTDGRIGRGRSVHQQSQFPDPTTRRKATRGRERKRHRRMDRGTSWYSRCRCCYRQWLVEPDTVRPAKSDQARAASLGPRPGCTQALPAGTPGRRRAWRPAIFGSARSTSRRRAASILF